MMSDHHHAGADQCEGCIDGVAARRPHRLEIVAKEHQRRCSRGQCPPMRLTYDGGPGSNVVIPPSPVRLATLLFNERLRETGRNPTN